MKQWLPRGLEIAPRKKIKKLIAGGDDWQIYLSNQDSYVLAATDSIYQKWVEHYSLPAGIFLEKSPLIDYRIFCSSGDYLVSSLDKGPYPENNGQVEAFSIAFNTALNLFPEADIHDAIYIEEYSLILPVSASEQLVRKDVVFGKWLTCGVNISIKSLNRIAQIMSWLPRPALYKSVQLAGFEVSEETIKEDSEELETKNMVNPGDNQDEFVISQKDKFTLIGRPGLEQFFNDNIIDIVTHQEQYKRMGISFPGATILYGPSGCGKTYAVEKLSEYLGWKRFDIDSSSIASSYIHDTSRRIAEVFNAAIKASPSIIVIDEMEAFLTNRLMAGPSGTHHVEEVAEFLRRIPEAITKGVLVFAMTNMIDSIDPAVLRRGRFDHIIEVKMASKEEIEALLRSRFAELPVEQDVNPADLAHELVGRPLSDVTFVLREAGRFAVKHGCEMINKECLIDAINLLPKKEEKKRIGF